MASSAPSNIVKIGPWGSGGGANDFSFGGFGTYIKEVIVYTGNYAINGLKFANVDDSGNPHTVTAGNLVGDAHTFQLDHDNDEYINWVHVSWTGTFITQLEFKTSLENKYGPYGPGGGHQITVPITIGKIVGFFGQYDSYITSIGIFVAPIAK